MNHLRARVKLRRLAGVVQQQDLVAARDQKRARRYRIRIAKVRLPSNALQSRGRIRAAQLGNDHHLAGVFGRPVITRINKDDLARLRDWLGVNEHFARRLVAIIDLLLGPIRVHRPQVMERHRVAVHIIPTRVQDASVGQDARGVLGDRTGRQHPQAGPVGIAAKQDGDRREPAKHIPLAARRTKRDPAVRQVRRLHVVPIATGDLPQAGPVGGDLVEIIVMRPAFPVGEQDPLRVVTDLRIADAALRIVQQYREPPGLGVETAEPRAVSAMQPFILAGAGITKVRVVMLARIPPGMALGKDNVRRDDRVAGFGRSNLRRRGHVGLRRQVLRPGRDRCGSSSERRQQGAQTYWKSRHTVLSAGML